MFVTNAFFSAPIMFFVSGFLLAYSLISESEPFSPKKIGLYYMKRLLKYAPMNAIVIMYALYFTTATGNGPIYADYYTTVE